MTGQEVRRSASSPIHPIVRILLIQLGLGMVVAMLFWGMSGVVSGYSAVLGSLICVVPNAFLALRLSVPRQDPGAKALLRAAWAGELGKLALTVAFFIVVFTLVKPLAVGALFAGFIAGQLATFAGFLMKTEDAEVRGTEEQNGG